MQIRDVAAGISPVAARRAAVLFLALLLAGCVTARHTGKRGLPEKQGTASYYADKFVGRTTANGEIYTHDAHTAAHLSLPFGTRVRVTRIDHAAEPSVVVRINDRGPFKHGRIIDLSKSAARELEMIREGVVEVRLEVLSYPEGTADASDSASAEDDGTKVGW